MEPMNIDQQSLPPSPPSTASFMSCVTVSCVLKVIAAVITGAAFIVLISEMFPEKNQSPAHTIPANFNLKFILDDFQVVELNANTSDLTITCTFIIHITVTKTDRYSWKTLPNPLAEVTVGDHVATIKKSLPPLIIDTPGQAEWNLAINETIISELDQKKVAHLKELVDDGVSPISFAVQIVGSDFQYRPFNATCTVDIYVFKFRPPPVICVLG